tara:strand:+ start:193 stop:501 length:309 start_codon:yes stop_codon:yes gene_type:complete
MNTISRNDNASNDRVRTPELKETDVPQPTKIQIRWMKRGVAQPGGKIPLFDDNGQKVNTRTVQSCLEHGWVEPWFANPIKPDWIICKLTYKGRKIIAAKNDC